MTAQIISFLAVLLVVALAGCSSLIGGRDAVCHTIQRQQEHYSHPFFHRRSPWFRSESIGDDEYVNYGEDDSHELLHTDSFLGQHLRRYRMVEKCCLGYVDNNGSCEPQCESKCENGYCSKPHKCTCNDGYEETFLNVCVPICDKVCINGKCTSPNNCTCNEGYEMNEDGHTCKPLCTSACENGWCSKPDVCECHPGYKRNDTNKCEPVCTLGCENGRCVDPDTCACNHGFQSLPGNNSVCVPRCKHPCLYGTCTAPEKCSCNDGYEATWHPFICKPKCESACDNGWCFMPNVCVCNTGYKIGNDTKCHPVCKRPCENGTCVAPDLCECNPGFEKSQNDAFACQPRCSRPCSSGKCTAPETCTCNPDHRLGADKYTCEPVCDMACENGYCAKPNVCECDPGYKKNGTNGCDPICEVPCLNGKCVGPDRCTCDVGFQPFEDDIFACEPRCSKPCEFGASCTAPETCTCDDGFLRDDAGNGSCVSACRTSCNQGTCTSKGCACLDGWSGDSCDKPLFCVVTQPVNVSSTKTPDELAASNQTKITDGNHQPKWKGPTCHTKCLDQLHSTAVNFTLTTGNVTQYLVAIDSLCNTVESKLNSSTMSSVVMGSVIGIALLAAVAILGVAIFMRIRRKPRTDQYTQRLVNECVDDDPMPL